MSTTALQVQTPDPGGAEIALPTGDLHFSDLMRLAEALVPTGFLPKHIKTAGQAVAIILAGREMGIGPMLALRSINLVEGKVVVAADLQLARFKADGGKARWNKLDERAAELWLRHPNGDEHVARFSIEDAQRAGLLSKNNWKQYPKAMLRSRTITAGLKDIGYEPVAGAYDPDEIPVPPPTTNGDTEHPADVAASVPPTPPAAPSGEKVATLEQAIAFPLPWPSSPYYNTPLGDIRNSLLWAAVEWCEKIMKQAEERGRTVSTRVQNLYDAAHLILSARETGELEEPPAPPEPEDPRQAKLFAEGEQRPDPTPAPSSDSSTSAGVASPSASEPARDPLAVEPHRGDPAPTSAYAYGKRVKALIDDERLPDDQRDYYKQRFLHAGMSAEKLARLEADLRHRLGFPQEGAQ
jgi:hypothetical protein